MGEVGDVLTIRIQIKISSLYLTGITTQKDHAGWANAWLTGTNLLVIPTLIYGTSMVHWMLAGIVSVASTLMHASEQKHGLPFNLCSTLFLNFDRFMSFVAFLVLAWHHLWNFEL